MKLKSLDYVDIIESFTNRYEHIVKKMRFQQRQQQERDQRKVEMVSATKTVTTTSGNSSSSSSTIRSSATTAIHQSMTTSSAVQQQDLSASLGAGKVRAMFEQRKAAGIDKSYPLQPIGQVVSKNGNTGAAPSKVAAATANGLNNKTRVPPISANTKARLARQHQQENGNGEVLGKSGGAASATFDDNENLLEDEKFPDTISFDEDFALTTGTPLARKLPNVGKLSTPGAAATTNGTVPAQNVNSLKLKPVPGRTPTTTSLKATPAAAPKKTPPAAPPSATNPSTPRGSQPSSAKSRASTGKSGTGMAASGSRKASAISVASASIASMDDGPVPDGMARCSVCGRNFAEDRVAKHMEICRKTKSKKRKVFDVTKHRVQGTDAEKYVLRKGKTGAAASSSSKKSISGPAASTAAAATSGGKGDWRRKHEEFIAAIRAAKEMKAYLAKGGKLSDLPPPPPSENPDYVQCPHCSRRFNQTAAERHIPKCKTMLHNKPKPAAKGRRV
ncbi:hypothetical protein pipiens_016737 [Culex pipiens pipiens]|uniref:C2HC/C3H-type domain-containing protein n=1 Tax=Culex pipiens pipiens TaxID=38569 RepID=A0ABD1CKU4_CULPP